MIRKEIDKMMIPRFIRTSPVKKGIIHKHHPEGKKDNPRNVELISGEEHARKHNILPNSAHPELRTIYKEYKFWQIEAGRMERMIGSYRGEIKNTTPSPYVRDEQFKDMEERLRVLKQKENGEVKKSTPVKRAMTIKKPTSTKRIFLQP